MGEGGKHEGPKAPIRPWTVEPPSPDGNTPQDVSGEHRRDDDGKDKGQK